MLTPAFEALVYDARFDNDRQPHTIECATGWETDDPIPSPSHRNVWYRATPAHRRRSAMLRAAKAIGSSRTAAKPPSPAGRSDRPVLMIDRSYRKKAAWQRGGRRSTSATLRLVRPHQR
jgi:hypothetical protein